MLLYRRFLPDVYCCVPKKWLMSQYYWVPLCCWLLCLKDGWCRASTSASWHLQCIYIFHLKQDKKNLGRSSSSKSYSDQQRTGNRKKQSKALHKSLTMVRGHTQQKVHPGMSSSQNHKTAHYGAVTGLRTTTDGMHLLSSGWVNFFSIGYLLLCLKLTCSALMII